MRKTLNTAVTLVLVVALVSGETKFLDEETQKKVSNLRFLVKKAYPGAHQMDSSGSDYRKYIELKPRPYTAVFFFYDTKNEEHKEEYKQFELVAQQFVDNNIHMTRKIDGKLHKPVFLFGMPYNKLEGDREYLNSIGATGASGIIISTGEEIGLQPDDLVLYNRKYLWKIQYSDGIITPKKITEYIGDKTGVIVKYKEPVSTFLYSFGIICLALVVLGFVYQKLFWLVVNVKTWIVIFFIGYYISSSAYIWTILNNPKWTGIKDDMTEWIFPSTGMQHKAEGFMMGGLICLIPSLVGFLMYINQKIESAIWRRVVSYPLLAAICYLFYLLEDVIKMKRFYEMNWVPADYFHKGPLRSDQGHFL